ncbi:MAG: ABC transporter permease [Gemmatimonadetes bacterium]|nr:ABC transporter permease [Gemmatimonadota bacterium]
MSKGRILPPDPEDAADWEVEHHLAELVDRLVQEGMTPEDARREAERRFGDPVRYRAALESDERRRQTTMKRTEWWGVFSGGVGRAMRSLRRSPGFSLGVVLTLALGIGANAAMFGVLDRLLFQPPPYIVHPESVRRVMLERPFMGRTSRQASITWPGYQDLKKVSAFQAVAAFNDPSPTTLGSGPDATRARVAMATWDFFPLLGVHAERGRFFSKDEDQADATPTAVLSHEYWRSNMGSDPDALGRTLEIAGHTYTVIGIAPPGFTGVNLEPVDIWVPLETAGTLNMGKAWLDSRGWYWFDEVVRLAPGVDVRSADAEATAAHVNGRREQIDAGKYPKEARIALDPVVRARGPEASGESKVARWLGGVSLLVLLIACANVANLLLARGTRRRREVAVRLALGVGRARLVTTMVVESLLLAILGGGVALLLASWGGSIIRKALLPGVYFPGSAVSGRVAAFTVAASLVAGLLAGIGPALQSTRSDLGGDLSMGAGASSGRRSRTRSFLTVAQAALSVVLLVGAGLFVRSVSAVHHLDLGLDVDRLVTARLEFETRAMKTQAGEEQSFGSQGHPEEENQVYQEALERLRSVPGVEDVAGTSSPFQWAFATELKVQGLDSLPRLAGGGPYFMDVTPGYLKTVGLMVTQGRDFTPADGPGGARIALVNETMARTVWPDQDALGQCLLIEKEQECTTVVGVAEDASRGDIDGDPFMMYYLPLGQHEGRNINALYIRTGEDPGKLSATVAPILRGLDTRIRYATVAPLRDSIDPQARSWTLGATMFTVFGLLALVVAAIGLYGVLAFDVAQRTRELGIRTALGAARGRLLRNVMWDGFRLAVAGVVLGLAISLLAAPFARDLLFHVSPRDPDVFVVVAVALILVALVASLIPGFRATRVDPAVALRTE